MWHNQGCVFGSVKGLPNTACVVGLCIGAELWTLTNLGNMTMESICIEESSF